MTAQPSTPSTAAAADAPVTEAPADTPANRAARRAAKKGKKSGKPDLPGGPIVHPRAAQGRRVNPIRRTGS